MPYSQPAMISYCSSVPGGQMPTWKIVDWNSGWISLGPYQAVPSPSYRGFFTLWSEAVVTAGAAVPCVAVLSSDSPRGYVLASQVHLQVQTAYSLSGGHSCALASLQVDRLDTSESLRKQEEHAVEPAPLLFGRWHPIVPVPFPGEGRQFIRSFPGWALYWGRNGQGRG